MPGYKPARQQIEQAKIKRITARAAQQVDQPSWPKYKPKPQAGVSPFRRMMSELAASALPAPAYVTDYSGRPKTLYADSGQEFWMLPGGRWVPKPSKADLLRDTRLRAISMLTPSGTKATGLSAIAKPAVTSQTVERVLKMLRWSKPLRRLNWRREAVAFESVPQSTQISMLERPSASAAYAKTPPMSWRRTFGHSKPTIAIKEELSRAQEAGVGGIHEPVHHLFSSDPRVGDFTRKVAHGVLKDPIVEDTAKITLLNKGYTPQDLGLDPTSLKFVSPGDKERFIDEMIANMAYGESEWHHPALNQMKDQIRGWAVGLPRWQRISVTSLPGLPVRAMPHPDFGLKAWTKATDPIEQSFSMHAITGKEPKVGFMVGIAPERMKEIPMDQFTPKAIIDFRTGNMDKLMGSQTYLGGWVDPETGTAVLDISKRFDTLEDALKAARQHGQKAIYDLKSKQTIPLEKYTVDVKG